jgi:uncharacterized integral membrane protein
MRRSLKKKILSLILLFIFIASSLAATFLIFRPWAWG